MPKPITLTLAAPAAPELTAAEQTAQRVVVDSDLALVRLANSIKRGFETVWGTLDNPRSKEDAQAIIDALGDDRSALFARHASIVAMLATGGLATFEPWEFVPAYPVDDQGQLGELALEWTQELT